MQRMHGNVRYFWLKMMKCLLWQYPKGSHLRTVKQAIAPANPVQMIAGMSSSQSDELTHSPTGEPGRSLFSCGAA